MIEVRTPSRLHFGLFAFNPDEARQFGGVGLMIRQPDLVLRIDDHADGINASGHDADRAADFAEKFRERATGAGLINHLPGAALRVMRSPRPHTGLGSGTQLGMAVAAGLARLCDRDDLDVATLASLVRRGKRSAIGAHGFATGGLIVEGGKAQPQTLSPMLMRAHFPDDWRLVLVMPRNLVGIAGDREIGAFKKMPPIPRSTTAEMCRLVLLGLAPAAIERDLATFSRSLYQLQRIVGECFAAAQGGTYADPMLAQVVDFVRSRGVEGVGQSSWGPTLYAITGSEDHASELAAAIQGEFGLDEDEVLVTAADNQGATVRIKDGAPQV